MILVRQAVRQQADSRQADGPVGESFQDKRKFPRRARGLDAPYAARLQRYFARRGSKVTGQQCVPRRKENPDVVDTGAASAERDGPVEPISAVGDRGPEPPTGAGIDVDFQTYVPAPMPLRRKRPSGAMVAGVTPGPAPTRTRRTRPMRLRMVPNSGNSRKAPGASIDRRTPCLT